MPAAIGVTALRALEHIHDALALDSAGIDFGLDGAGNVLFFEANAAMTINPPDRDPRRDYRRAPVAAFSMRATDAAGKSGRPLSYLAHFSVFGSHFSFSPGCA